MRVLPDRLQDAAAAAAVPTRTANALERLLAVHPDLDEQLGSDAALGALAAVTSASRSLTRVLESDPAALTVLHDLDRRAPERAGNGADLLAWKHRELLRIAARDLTGQDPLDAIAAALARLGADVLAGAVRLASADHLAVIGMGKLGGGELNYASDIDVLFVGDGEPEALARQARGVLDLARPCFRVDAGLRPEGRDGPLVRSVPAYRAHWQRWAQAWERQALLKARPVAGDADLGQAWADAAEDALWAHPVDADDIRAVREMKHRSEEEVARQGLSHNEIKRGPGGIRDIEFALQLLQMVHGGLDPALRSPTTLAVLAEMRAAGYVDPEAADQLAAAYRFLRRVEHALQLEDEHQVHVVPASDPARSRLARILGYRSGVAADARERFDADLAAHRVAARAIHERLWFRPLLEAFAGNRGGLAADATAERLAAFGFADLERTREAVTDLTRGLTRSSRLMQQLLPLILDWLSQAPDPDLGLLTLRHLTERPDQATHLAATFRESPEVARALCRVIGTSRKVGEILARHPDLVARLGAPDDLRTRSRAELVQSAEAAIGWRPDEDDRQEALRRWQQRHLFGIAARDLLGHADPARVGRDLATLAEATLEVALATLDPRLPFALVAVGRFGGQELSYASDLDIHFVFDGAGPEDLAEAERLATGLRRLVDGSPARRIYTLDTDLRPEGRQGPAARSIVGYNAYFERWALTWERQAMTRARPVAGDLALGRGLVNQLAPAVWRVPDEAAIRDIRRMKARIEAERLPAGEDPDFHLKLGRGSLTDIEFTVQLLALTHDVRSPATLTALDRLEGIGAVERADADTLRTAYEFCERTRNREYLVSGRAADALPQDPLALTRLARALDTTAAGLRNDYRRVTRKARGVVERLFYGMDAQ
ncbi:MAG: bifunctional [glutamine synthetase] adenylyltransferase/[glutamine synthetase]-adenylyl-L-tyrosine phosphorylase [Acidimicrobiales bacterium]